MKAIINSYLFLKSKLQYLKSYYRIKRWIDNGLQLGENVTIMPSVQIDDEYAYLIKIGDNCSLSHRTNILAHDATTFKYIDGHTRLQRVVLNDNVFVGSDVIILPGVTIGSNVMIAAGSVVNKDIPPNTCIMGVPARRYQSFNEYLEKHKEQVCNGDVVQYKDLNGPNYHKYKKWILKAIEEKGIAYVQGFSGDFPYTYNGSDFH